MENDAPAVRGNLPARSECRLEDARRVVHGERLVQLRRDCGGPDVPGRSRIERARCIDEDPDLVLAERGDSTGVAGMEHGNDDGE